MVFLGARAGLAGVLIIVQCSLLLQLCILQCFASHPHSKSLKRRAFGGITVPLSLSTANSPLLGRAVPESGAGIGLGDYKDITYNVLISVGSTVMPVVLDTGSSDLWVLTDTCTSEDCKSPASGIPQANARYSRTASFQSANLDALLLYGDSLTGTKASGIIGSDTVGIALSGDDELQLDGQYFAAINSTTTKVLSTGSTGIFGLGFPLNSPIWNQAFVAMRDGLLVAARDNLPENATEHSNNYNTAFFPDLKSLTHPKLSSRQDLNISPLIQQILASYSTIGPLLPRLVLKGILPEPMFTISLQRNTMDVGGNVGLLTLGAAPAGVDESKITWANIRKYDTTQGGLEAPSDSPNEVVYPLAWEIPIDDVYFDGQVLAKSTLADSSISLSALVDTGNSLLRGPADVVQDIWNILKGTVGSTTNASPHFPCSTPHTLAFKIGGKMFPVDPRDFVSQAFAGNPGKCVPNLVATDTPKLGGGYLYQWNLGTPFLKSVEASFHYGNITHPSQDAPRIGLLSTVPSNANALFMAAANAANKNGNFPVTVNEAPSTAFKPASVNTDGVGQATQTLSVPTGNSGRAVRAHLAGPLVLVTSLASITMHWSL